MAPSSSAPPAATSLATTPEELHDWRQGIDTGGWLHMNAAGASPAHWSCHQAQKEHLELERTMGGYDAAAAAAGTDPRAPISALLQCDASEVALTESAQVGGPPPSPSLAGGGTPIPHLASARRASPHLLSLPSPLLAHRPDTPIPHLALAHPHALSF
jgi:hypothetical protein